MSGLTLEEKFAKTVIRLRSIRPFYAAVYETIEKVETKTISTVGVTCDKMIYNKEFLEEVEYSEFLFIMLHEIAHIALMHVARMGDRDMRLWNLACDLYVNKLLGEEFNLQPGKLNTDLDIKMSSWVHYLGSINTERDTVEELYALLKKIYDYMEQHLDPSSSKSNSNGNGSNAPELSGASREMINKWIKEQKLDLVDNGEDKVRQIDKSERLVTTAKTRYEMCNGDRSVGTTAGGLEELVNELLKSKVDWKKLLRKYCIQYYTKDLSFASPDKRMYYQNAIYPGFKSNAVDVLKDVKVCIDTSGSISKDDLGHFFGQIKQLLKAYKTPVEVFDWDTEIEQQYTLEENEIRNKVQHKIVGLGGTDPSCLFEYFDSKACKVKPFVTIIFTDGYLLTEEFPDKWVKKYRNTIWIMTRDYNKNFNPNFGKVAFAEFDS